MLHSSTSAQATPGKGITVSRSGLVPAQPKLTPTVGSIVGGEDGHVVGGSVAAQAGAVVAAVRVVAAGFLTADFVALYLTFILIYDPTRVHHNISRILTNSATSAILCPSSRSYLHRNSSHYQQTRICSYKLFPNLPSCRRTWRWRGRWRTRPESSLPPAHLRRQEQRLTVSPPGPGLRGSSTDLPSRRAAAAPPASCFSSVSVSVCRLHRLFIPIFSLSPLISVLWTV